jgi:hypothetical protein
LFPLKVVHDDQQHVLSIEQLVEEFHRARVVLVDEVLCQPFSGVALRVQ